MINSPAELQSVLQSRSTGIAAGDATGQVRRFEFGHLVVELAFNDERLGTLCWRALKHLSASPGRKADIRINWLCGDVAAAPLPRLGWSVPDFGPKRTVPGWSDVDRTTFLLRTERGVAVYNHAERVAHIWIPSFTSLAWWERAAPMRWLLDVVANHNSLCTVHAGCVTHKDAAVLMAGPGGSGKSSLALACASQGLAYLADDYCVLDLRSTPRCHSMYCSAKWRTRGPVLPELLASVSARACDMSGDKAIVFVDEVGPLTTSRHGAVKAILLPRKSSIAKPVISPATSGDAVRFMMPSTVAQSEAPAEYVLTKLAALARQVPAFHFDMPPDPDLCASHLACLLDQLAGTEVSIAHTGP